jgi:nucleoside-diphosphate-sugar epimerase
MNFLLGGRGRLGQAIRGSYSEDEMVALERDVYAAWSNHGATDAVTDYLAQAGADEESIIFVASGLLDPRSPEDDLRGVNYRLPCNVIEASRKLGSKVVTFGTVMEALLHEGNPYVRSKAELGEYVATMDAPGVVHVRIHTLYGGGAPSPFMFLGLVRAAILDNAPFAMTQGRQLREYHHVMDDAHAVRTILESGASGCIDLSHGNPVSLRDLAKYVFASLGASELLELGALPEPREENYTRVFPRPAMLDEVFFRETLPAVAQYMKAHLPAKNQEIRKNGAARDGK